jgi:fructose/tagatose bisphosphate aldolase
VALKTVVKMAHAGGVSVEGELGCLGSLETGMMGEEDGHGAEGKLINFTHTVLNAFNDFIHWYAISLTHITAVIVDDF